jgi:uncharacterized caspase-like protein
MSGQRRALLIGTAAYPADPALPDLRCPINDVDGMSEVLKSPELGGFEVVETLRDPTSSAAKRALVAFCRDAKRDDTVLFYYSGHGKLDSSFALHLCTTDSEIDLLEATALPITFVRDQFRKCRAENRVMLLDCCFSGAAAGVSARSALDDTLKLSVEGTGTYLMTASDSIETAQEKEGDDYGVFTKHVIEGLKTGAADVIGRGYVTMDDLYEYVAKEIRADSPQRPNREFTGHGDILIARSGKDSRKDRANDARQLLFRHVAEGTLDANVASAAFAALSKPIAQQTPADRAIEGATLSFLDGKSTLGEFVSAYWQARKDEQTTPPEKKDTLPAKGTHASGAQGSTRQENEGPAKTAGLETGLNNTARSESEVTTPTKLDAASIWARNMDQMAKPMHANFWTPLSALALGFMLMAFSAGDPDAAASGPIVSAAIILFNLSKFRSGLTAWGWLTNSAVLVIAILIFVAYLLG